VLHPALWLDMTVSVRDASTSYAFEKAFDVQALSPMSSIGSDIARIRPSVAFFDFDFPTRQGLNVLKETKRCFPSLPIVMLTVQHSEALAVWAFRSRVWDYIVKPLSAADTDRCVASLVEMLGMRDIDAAPRSAAIPGALIPEEHRLSGTQRHDPATLAPAISYVEQNFRGKVTSARAAALCGLSAFQFSRTFREMYAITFQEYLLRFRVREACRLLRNPAAQVADVALLAGFNDASYFCKIFKRYTSMSPSRFSAATETPVSVEQLLGSVGAGDTVRQSVGSPPTS
jgi:AraC-like DNA-binding protein/ActR/RegA family two-component response regulator